jgi:arylsulfatase A-like enzyme/Flp pilus assembly protein TadD
MLTHGAGGRGAAPLVLATLVVATVWTGCRAPVAVPLGGPGAHRGANVLLITIDTLRRDRVGAFGGPSGLTPALDGLAASGVRYSQAFTTAPLTLPAHASILTGLEPRHHGIRNNTSFRLRDATPTIASLLHKAGYRTGAFVGAFVLDGRFGLSAGFDTYDDQFPREQRPSFEYAQRRAGEVVKLAADWILDPARAAGPWFAWVHLFDPHAPYDAPVPYRDRWPAYDAEVAYTDAMIGELLTRLRAGRALDDTLTIVTADHGESLGEHGEATHGLFAYNATLAVPLLISAPWVKPAVIDLPVTHTDLAPTILDIVGAPPLEHGDGMSLLHTVPLDRPVVFEALDASITRGWAPLQGVVQNRWKFIDLPEPELYDLSADPHEQHNRAGSDSRQAALARLLPPIEVEAPSARALDRDAAQRLQSLGYVGGRAPAGRATIADDPKRLVALNEAFNQALTAFDAGRRSIALEGFLAVLRQRPDFDSARASAATVLSDTGRHEEAVALLREGLSRRESVQLLAKLGATLRDAGDLQGSVDAYKRARQLGDQNPDLLNDLATVLARLNRVDEARALFEELLARDPKASTTWFNLGLLELQNRDPHRGSEALRHAVTLDPAYGDAWNALGVSLVGVDRTAAIDAWQHAERLLPHDYDLLFNLATVMSEGSNPRDALPYLQRFVREAPAERYAADISHLRQTIAKLERAGG